MLWVQPAAAVIHPTMRQRAAMLYLSKERNRVRHADYP